MKNVKLAFSNEVTIKSISVKQWRDIDDAGLNDFDRTHALVAAMTGIADDKLLDMPAPDYNTIKSECIDWALKSAHDIIGYELSPSTEKITLLKPIESETGEKITVVNLGMPTVRHCKTLAAIDDDSEREAFVFQSVTGLSKNDMLSLTTNDYRTLDEMVANFFHGEAEFFLASNK